MKLTTIISLLLLGAAQAQAQATPQDTQAAVLTLEEAVSLALSNNRAIKSTGLEATKFDFRVSTAHSRRLPQFQIAALGGELLHSFDFTFPAGAFGTYNNVGPIPNTEKKIRTPARFTTYTTAAVDQPLTQQYKIGLGIRVAEIEREIAKEDVRAERQRIVAATRNAYFDLVATQAGVEAARQSVAALQEAQSLTSRYLAQQTVLKGDALEIDARLAKSRYELSAAENTLATERESLNQLLGRDLSTPFRVAAVPEDRLNNLTMEDARQKAVANRPDLREAHLKEKQAEFDRRIAKAEYIPDLSFSLRYQGIENVSVLPANVATVGFYLTWEPFDWGRRRNNIAEKALAVEQARTGSQEVESHIALEVGAKYRKSQEATLLLKAIQIGHEAAAEQLRVTLNKYQQQAALIKDLLQAQARGSETEFQFQQALSSYWSALADLRRAMGEE